LVAIDGGGGYAALAERVCAADTGGSGGRLTVIKWIRFAEDSALIDCHASCAPVSSRPAMD
jgi:hypothetical protein